MSRSLLWKQTNPGVHLKGFSKKSGTESSDGFVCVCLSGVLVTHLILTKAVRQEGPRFQFEFTRLESRRNTLKQV